MKKCSKCNIEKELNCFNKSSRHRLRVDCWCRMCRSDYRKNNKAAIKKYEANYRKQNRDIVNAKTAEYKRLNPQKIKAVSKRYRDNNKEKIKLANKKWGEENIDKKRADCRKRQASKLNATPSWLTKEQLEEIGQIYKDCVDLQWLSKEPLEVDHIVPLQGKNVCGLHVPWNLQIMTRSMNRKKGNEHD